MILSFWVNIYEEIIKQLFTDHQPSQPSNLVKRIAVLSIFSLVYIVGMTVLTPVLIKKIWCKTKDWIREINIEKLTYNAMAPSQPIRR